MIKSFYDISRLAIVFFAAVYVIYLIITCIKKTDSSIRAIKTRIVAQLVLILLFIVNMILSLILGKSVIDKIGFILLYATLIITDCKFLKNTKKTENILEEHNN